MPTVLYCLQQEVIDYMNIIINNSSMIPIYEQIVMQMKDKILAGQLKPDTMLPSVRSLSKDLRISALTVKKAYDAMEQEGYIVTVHGKGSFVANISGNIAIEEKQKEVEKLFEQGIRKAKECGMSHEETVELFKIVLSDFS